MENDASFDIAVNSCSNKYCYSFLVKVILYPGDRQDITQNDRNVIMVVVSKTRCNLVLR